MQDPTPPNHNIYITGSNTSTGVLTLTEPDGGPIYVSDTVTWILQAGCGVTSISAIVEKPGSPDVFNPDPAPVPGSTDWQGTINPNLDPPVEEYYSITWIDPQGNSHIYDPKIQVDPD